MILAAGQWKMISGVKVENTTDKTLRVNIQVIDLEKEQDRSERFNAFIVEDKS